jgi:hypothetical protein
MLNMSLHGMAWIRSMCWASASGNPDSISELTQERITPLLSFLAFCRPQNWNAPLLPTTQGGSSPIYYNSIRSGILGRMTSRITNIKNPTCRIDNSFMSVVTGR